MAIISGANNNNIKDNKPQSTLAQINTILRATSTHAYIHMACFLFVCLFLGEGFFFFFFFSSSSVFVVCVYACMRACGMCVRACVRVRARIRKATACLNTETKAQNLPK